LRASSVVQGLALEELSRLSREDRSTAQDFLVVLAVCHTVVIEQLEGGGSVYQVSQ
jgi:hypothetical protein